jgi:hypothetical protein
MDGVLWLWTQQGADFIQVLVAHGRVLPAGNGLQSKLSGIITAKELAFIVRTMGFGLVCRRRWLFSAE